MSNTVSNISSDIHEISPVAHNPFATGELEIVMPASAAQLCILEASAQNDTAAYAAMSGLCIHLRGTLDNRALKAASQALMDRHSSLRGIFSSDLQQFCVLENVDVRFEEESLPGDQRKTLVNRGELLERYLEPFDVHKGPLVKFLLVKVSPEYHQLFIIAHQAICDLWSYDVLLLDLAKLYTAMVDGAAHSETKKDAYSTYMVQKIRAQKDHGYQSQFQRIKESVEKVADDIVDDSKAMGGTVSRSGRIVRRFDQAFTQKMRATARTLGCSFYGLCSAAFGELIRSKLHKSTMVMGIPSAGQMYANQNECVGQCVSLMPFIYRFPQNERKLDLVSNVNRSMLKALEFQDCSYFDVQGLSTSNGIELPPVLPVGIGMSKLFREADLVFRGLSVDYELMDKPYDCYLVYLHCHEGDDRCDFEIRYAESCFDSEKIQSFMDEFAALLEAIADEAMAVRDSSSGEHGATVHKVPENTINPSEQKIRTILEEISGFDIQSVDTATTFLEMGLDSLLLTQVATVLSDTFGVKLTFRQLLSEYATIGQLVSLVGGTTQTEEKDGRETEPDEEAVSVHPVLQSGTTPEPQAASSVSSLGAQALLAAFVERYTSMLSEGLDLFRMIQTGKLSDLRVAEVQKKKEFVLQSNDVGPSSKMIFFDGSRGNLYGAIHAPSPAIARSKGVLLCYPGPQESMRVHWAFRQLALNLCKCGFHVLRFDYTGTGDSVGRDSDGMPDVWVEDIRAAQHELSRQSGVTTLSAVAVRLGAALFSKAIISSATPYETVVLWDPVIDGREYLQELVSLHARLFKQPRKSPKGAMQQELLGYYIDDRIRRQIEELQFDRRAFPAETKLHICLTEDAFDSKDHHGSPIENMGVDQYHSISDSIGWGHASQLEDAVLPNRTIAKITAILSEEKNHD